jgi:hypothetical protein
VKHLHSEGTFPTFPAQPHPDSAQLPPGWQFHPVGRTGMSPPVFNTGAFLRISHSSAGQSPFNSQRSLDAGQQSMQSPYSPQSGQDGLLPGHNFPSQQPQHWAPETDFLYNGPGFQPYNVYSPQQPLNRTGLLVPSALGFNLQPQQWTFGPPLEPHNPNPNQLYGHGLQQYRYGTQSFAPQDPRVPYTQQPPQRPDTY